MRAGAGCFRGSCWAGAQAEAGTGAGGWAGLGLGLGLGLAALKRKFALFENGKVVSQPDKGDQQQQAISIYFFLEGLGFRV